MIARTSESDRKPSRVLFTSGTSMSGITATLRLRLPNRNASFIAESSFWIEESDAPSFLRSPM